MDATTSIDKALQRSEEWHAQRLGVFTSSEIYKLMGSGKGKMFTDAGEKYIMEKVAERLTGCRDDVKTTPAMQWGIDNEPKAKQWVAKIKGWEIHDTGFVKHHTLNYGGSGDGWVRDINGAIEVKCLNTANHLQEVRYSETIEELKSNYPNRYWQVTSDAFLRGCDKIIMCWFDPRINNKFGLVIREFPLNKADAEFMIKRIEAAEKIFNEQLEFFK
jgi:hypothetical protein